MGFRADARRFDVPIIRWFAPPSLPSREASRRAYALWMLAWPFFAVLTVVLGISVAVNPDTLSRRAVTIVAVGALVAILHEVSRRGRTELASWMLVLGLTAVLTHRAWGTGGIHANVAMFYAIFVMMGGGLLGARGAIVSAMACILSALFLTGAELLGFLVPPANAGSMVSAFLAVVLTIALTLVLENLLVRQAQRAATEDLVQMFVHDMRSPLTVLVARLTMLREDVRDGKVSADIDEAIGDVMTLNRLANNLLDINRLDLGHMPIARATTNVAQVARNVVHALGALEPTRRFEVNAAPSVVCECDPELMRRVIENLVGNAMKHTAMTGVIRVEVASTPECVRIAVQDEGPGIPPDDRDRIFNRFSALGLRSETGQHSVGLGLAFCALAVEAQGGRISVDAANPRGSVFVVEIPER